MRESIESWFNWQNCPKAFTMLASSRFAPNEEQLAFLFSALIDKATTPVLVQTVVWQIVPGQLIARYSADRISQQLSPASPRYSRLVTFMIP
jgi:hypothetical protein